MAACDMNESNAKTDIYNAPSKSRILQINKSVFDSNATKGQNLWRIRALRMDLRRLMALRQRLTNEAECYRLARDCYKAIQKLDEAKK